MAVDEQESAPPLARPDSGDAGGAGRRGFFRSFRPVRAVPEVPINGQRRRRSLELIALVAVCAVVAGGTGLTAILTRSTRHATVRSPAATCVAPEATPVPAANSAEENASRRLGTWGFNLLEAGTFGSVVAGPGSSLYALQACGVEETQLRVLRLSANGNVLAVSVDFDRAALLTSSLGLQGGSLYVGAARLDLSGPLTGAPYELTLYRLSPTSLHILGSRPLGRGYGLSLLATDAGHSDASVLASTGARLLAVRAGTVSVRTLATFGRSVAQHVSADPGAPYAAVNVFAPGAVPAAGGETVELVDARTGGVVSSARLVAGAQVESLAFGEGSLFVALGDGLSTEVRRFALPDLATPGAARGLPTGLPATIQTILLDTGRTVWATDLRMLACLDSSTGRVLSSSQSSLPMSVSGLVGDPGATYAVTASGIGLLQAPTACRGAAVG